MADGGIGRRAFVARTGAIAAAAAGGAWLLSTQPAGAQPGGGHSFNRQLAALNNRLGDVQARLGSLAEVAADTPEPDRPEALRLLAAIGDQADEIGTLADSIAARLAPV
jgi:hypothetical protein